MPKLAAVNLKASGAKHFFFFSLNVVCVKDVQIHVIN